MPSTRTADRTFKLHPITESGVVDLRVRHSLEELPIPAVTGDGPETVARWFKSLADEHGLTCRLYASADGRRWLIVRDRIGMYHYGQIDAVLSAMEREVRSGVAVGSPSQQEKKDRFAAFLSAKLRRNET